MEKPRDHGCVDYHFFCAHLVFRVPGECACFVFFVPKDRQKGILVTIDNGQSGHVGHCLCCLRNVYALSSLSGNIPWRRYLVT